MPEIRFYHLQSQTLIEALPALLIKAIQSGKPILVKMADRSMLETLNKHLSAGSDHLMLPREL